MATRMLAPSAVMMDGLEPSVSRYGSVQVGDYGLSRSKLNTLQAELLFFISKDRILTDPGECFDRSNTDWAPAQPEQKPAVVVLPENTEEVSKILNLCCRFRIPVTSCSGRTSLTGSLISTRGGLCVDFQRMNKVLAVHQHDFDAVVQPGVGWRDLHEQLGPSKLFFPPDPGPDACIGGMISTSCAGTNAYRFGTMKEWVIGLTVVLADGTVVNTKRRPRKASNGYDLTHLIIGAEGTLGLVTEAVIKLAPVPANQHVAIVTFATLREAAQAGLEYVASGLVCDALELLDKNSMSCVNKAKLSERMWDENPTLLLKLSGTPSSVQDLVDSTRKLFEAAGCLKFHSTSDPDEQKLFWTARKFSGRAFYETREDPGASYLCSDSTVPISRAADLMEAAEQMAAEVGMPTSFLVHLGDGNVHCQVLAPRAKLDEGKDLISRIELRAVDMDGTISGEHGIGTTRREQLIYELGENAVDMMRCIKLALDPHCILNPDKVMKI